MITCQWPKCITEDVTTTFLFYGPHNAAWHLAKVTAEADRPCRYFGGAEERRWFQTALKAIYPQFRPANV